MTEIPEAQTRDTVTQAETGPKDGLQSLSLTDGRLRCPATKKNGGQCLATPTATGFCPWHDPSRPQEEKLAWAARGGLVAQLRGRPDLPPVTLKSPEDVAQVLESTATEVLRGQLPPAVANSVAYVCSVALRSFELDVSRRLLELEKAAQERGVSITARLPA